LGELLDLQLVSLPQQRQLLALALLDRGQQRRTQRLHLAAQLLRPLDQLLGPDRSDRLVETGHDQGNAKFTPCQRQ
jgi:hypothetical protein